MDDVDLKKKFWHKELEQRFENVPEDPEVALFKVSAEGIQTCGRIGDAVLE